MKIIRGKLPVYQIQEYGLILIPDLGEGRLIPAVVLNSSTDVELKEFLQAHVSTVDQGDVTTQWTIPVAQFFKTKDWLLHVQLHKPRDFSFYISFNLEKHVSTLDAIFLSRGLYIRYGFPGDKISKGGDEATILMEIPDLKQDEEWEKTLKDLLRARLKKQKIPKFQLSNEVNKQILKGREHLKFRRNT